MHLDKYIFTLRLVRIGEVRIRCKIMVIRCNNVITLQVYNI